MNGFRRQHGSGVSAAIVLATTLCLGSLLWLQFGETTATEPAPRGPSAKGKSTPETGGAAPVEREPKIVATLTGKVVSIADGDTLTILTDDKQQVKVRLEGIDTPERGQAFGSKAKDALADMVFGKSVTIRKTGTDKYDRTLGFVEVDGTDVNLNLVENGWAWHYTKYNSQEKFAKAEIAARTAKRGLWSQDGAMAPWDFRAMMKKPEITPSTAVGPPATKGDLPTITPGSASPDASREQFWLNTSSNVRHNSNCKNFSNTKRGRFCGPSEGKACGICGG